jgi:protein TonB
MDATKKYHWKFIGVSAGLHLVIGGLFFHVVLKPISAVETVSAIQVGLVNSAEIVPVEVKPRRQSRSPEAPSTPSARPPVQLEPSMPAAAETADAVDTESVISEPVRGQTVPALSESHARDDSASENGAMTESDSRPEELNRFLQEVRSRLEQAKRYPWLARTQGIEGTVRLRFTINPLGEANKIHLVESSRSKILDEEAIETVERASRLPIPPGNTGIELEIPMVFRLSLQKTNE